MKGDAKSMAVKILLLEDERTIRSFIRINLKRKGFEVIEASSGEEALQLFEKNRDISVAVLDVMLPGISGFEVCSAIRRIDTEMGIIMLTAKSQEEDKIEGFDTGADDYVTKPFSPSELIARINALLRRVGDREEQIDRRLKSGPFVLEMEERRLFKSGVEIEITPTEFSILELFMKSEGKKISKDHILDAIWGENYVGDMKIVSVNIRRLRSKIENEPSQPRYIETIWGYGYRWREEERA